MQRLLLFLMVLFGIALQSNAQSGKQVFRDSMLHEIRVKIDLPDWITVFTTDYTNYANDPVRYTEVEHYCKVWFDGNFIDSVGFREKGNFSNQSTKATNKKPFKLSFDAFIDNQRFDGLRKINLNNGTDDPSFVREAIAYQLMRKAGLPAPRTAFARLYVNDDYWGLYELVENVDKTFLGDRFGTANNDGNLYKTTRTSGVDFIWKSANKADYEKGLELKTNESIADWKRFIHFVDVINHNPNATMKAALDSVFDVNSYLHALAVEKLIFSWDSYWGGGNNFYIYEHPNGKIYWIPWDENESFQLPEGLYALLLTSTNFLIPSNKFDERPLLKAIFSVPEYQTAYLDIVCDLLQETFTITPIAKQAAYWQGLIRAAYADDPQKFNTLEDFDKALAEEVSQTYAFPRKNISFVHPLAALLPFVTTRREWALEELKLHNFTCETKAISTKHYTLTCYPQPVTTMLTITLQEAQRHYSRIRIIDTKGSLVMQTMWQFDTAQLQLDVSSLMQGLYLIQKQDTDGSIGTCKFIKL